MRKVINKERVEGLIYDHTLTVKTVQSSESANYGKNFISGNLDIATDDDCENIVAKPRSYRRSFDPKDYKHYIIYEHEPNDAISNYSDN